MGEDLPAGQGVEGLAEALRIARQEPAQGLADIGRPQTRYTIVGGLRLAYQILGQGPPDLLWTPGSFSHVDVKWDEPTFAYFNRRLASFTRLICFDRRGSGASDRMLLPDALFRPETWIEDMRAALDAAGSERAIVFAAIDAGPAALHFATQHPDRTAGLILALATARYLVADDYPEGVPEEPANALVDAMEAMWGTEQWSRLVYPDRADDPQFLAWASRYFRSIASPREGAALLRGGMGMDARDCLERVAAPTLILHRVGYRLIPIIQARYMAEHIPGARLIELPGEGSIMGEYVDETMAAVSSFVSEVSGVPAPPGDRILATVMFTDVVGSTERAAGAGDRQWRQTLDQHDDIVRRRVAESGGRHLHFLGDGAVAIFDLPSQALECATALVDAFRSFGLQIRAGLHVGEVERRGSDIGGIAVHIAARVTGVAGPSQVVVSETVKDLAAGSRFAFADAGEHVLKGVPDRWHLWRVEP